MQNSMRYPKAIVFMKIGYHCDESLEEIIKRKKEEENKTGKIFWGYGGSFLHPLTQLKPFIQKALQRKLNPVLLLSLTPSKYIAQPKLAKEYSPDRKIWFPLPKGVLVKGSKFAIICRNLKKVNVKINLNVYEVAIGKNKGRPLGEVIKARVDKACGFLNPRYAHYKRREVKISYIAEIIRPYAVFLK